MKNLFFAIVLMFIGTSVFATDYNVTGAIEPLNINGIYYEVPAPATKGGVPYYVSKNKDNPALYYDGKEWIITADKINGFSVISKSKEPPNVAFSPYGKAKGNPIPTAISVVPVSKWSILALFMLAGLFILFRSKILKKADAS